MSGPGLSEEEKEYLERFLSGVAAKRGGAGPGPGSPAFAPAGEPVAPAIAVVTALQDLDLTSRGSGADNICNITGSPTASIVQQRMRERAAELWAWLQESAHLFVCGAAQMARDVDTALAAIVARQGKMGASAAKSRLGSLAREGRFLKDV